MTSTSISTLTSSLCSSEAVMPGLGHGPKVKNGDSESQAKPKCEQGQGQANQLEQVMPDRDIVGLINQEEVKVKVSHGEQGHVEAKEKINEVQADHNYAHVSSKAQVPEEQQKENKDPKIEGEPENVDTVTVEPEIPITGITSVSQSLMAKPIVVISETPEQHHNVSDCKVRVKRINMKEDKSQRTRRSARNTTKEMAEEESKKNEEFFWWDTNFELEAREQWGQDVVRSNFTINIISSAATGPMKTTDINLIKKSKTPRSLDNDKDFFHQRRMDKFKKEKKYMQDRKKTKRADYSDYSYDDDDDDIQFLGDSGQNLLARPKSKRQPPATSSFSSNDQYLKRRSAIQAGKRIQTWTNDQKTNSDSSDSDEHATVTQRRGKVDYDDEVIELDDDEDDNDDGKCEQVPKSHEPKNQVRVNIEPVKKEKNSSGKPRSNFSPTKFINTTARQPKCEVFKVAKDQQVKTDQDSSAISKAIESSSALLADAEVSGEGEKSRGGGGGGGYSSSKNSIPMSALRVNESDEVDAEDEDDDDDGLGVGDINSEERRKEEEENSKVKVIKSAPPLNLVPVATNNANRDSSAGSAAPTGSDKEIKTSSNEDKDLKAEVSGAQVLPPRADGGKVEPEKKRKRMLGPKSVMMKEKLARGVNPDACANDKMVLPENSGGEQKDNELPRNINYEKSNNNVDKSRESPNSNKQPEESHKSKNHDISLVNSAPPSAGLSTPQQEIQDDTMQKLKNFRKITVIKKSAVGSNGDDARKINDSNQSLKEEPGTPRQEASFEPESAQQVQAPQKQDGVPAKIKRRPGRPSRDEASKSDSAEDRPLKPKKRMGRPPKRLSNNGDDQVNKTVGGPRTDGRKGGRGIKRKRASPSTEEEEEHVGASTPKPVAKRRNTAEEEGDNGTESSKRLSVDIAAAKAPTPAEPEAASSTPSVQTASPSVYSVEAPRRPYRKHGEIEKLNRMLENAQQGIIEYQIRLREEMEAERQQEQQSHPPPLPNGAEHVHPAKDSFRLQEELVAKVKELKAKAKELELANQKLERKDRELHNAAEKLSLKDKELLSRDKSLVSKDKLIASKEQEIASKTEELVSMVKDMSEKDDELESLRKDMKEREAPSALVKSCLESSVCCRLCKEVAVNPQGVECCPLVFCRTCLNEHMSENNRRCPACDRVVYELYKNHATENLIDELVKKFYTREDRDKRDRLIESHIQRSKQFQRQQTQS